MNSSYRLKKEKKIACIHRARVPKRHYKSLKRHYRAPEIFFFLKLDFEKIEFQKKDISLIDLGNGAKCYFFCPKRAFAKFVPYMCVESSAKKVR